MNHTIEQIGKGLAKFVQREDLGHLNKPFFWFVIAALFVWARWEGIL